MGRLKAKIILEHYCVVGISGHFAVFEIFGPATGENLLYYENIEEIFERLVFKTLLRAKSVTSADS